MLKTRKKIRALSSPCYGKVESERMNHGHYSGRPSLFKVQFNQVMADNVTELPVIFLLVPLFREFSFRVFSDFSIYSSLILILLGFGVGLV